MTLTILYPISGFKRTFKNIEQHLLNTLITQLSNQNELAVVNGREPVNVVVTVSEDEPVSKHK